MSNGQSTVLLVEDEPLIRLFLSQLLEEEGYRVIETANATEALTILEAGRAVDVLVTDVDMSCGDNGFELAQKVSKSFSHIEILILSGRRWPSAGDLPPGTAFLAKPCPNEAIVAHVQSALVRARGRAIPSSADEIRGSADVLPFPKTA